MRFETSLEMTKINHATNSLRDWLYDDRDALHPVIVIK